MLWTMVLLALLASRVTGAGRGEAQLARNLRRAAVAEAAADGAVWEAAFRLRAGGEAGWRIGEPHRISVGETSVDVATRGEDDLINPNTARPPLLIALLRTLGAPTGEAEAVAAAILAWRAPVDRPEALAAAYRAAGRDYAPPGAPLRHIEELRLVLGVTPALYAALAPHLSLYQQAEPTRRSADPVVVAALRLAGEAEDARAGDADDRPVVEITAAATTREGGRFTRLAILRLADGSGARPFQTLAWRAR